MHQAPPSLPMYSHIHKYLCTRLATSLHASTHVFLFVSVHLPEYLIPHIPMRSLPGFCRRRHMQVFLTTHMPPDVYTLDAQTTYEST